MQKFVRDVSVFPMSGWILQINPTPKSIKTKIEGTNMEKTQKTETRTSFRMKNRDDPSRA